MTSTRRLRLLWSALLGSVDAASGLFLAVSPFLLGFHEHVYWPHLILGLAELAASQLTEKVPAYGPRHQPVLPKHASMA